MANLNLSQRMRCAHVMRWHMVRTYRQQTLAEHMALTQLVALEVVDRCYPNDKDMRLAVMEWALWHDMPEVVTGDVATPLKGLLAKSGNPCLIKNIEKGVDDRFAQLSLTTKEIPKLIITFADLFEAIHFIHEEGSGVRSQAIERHLMERMVALIAEVRRDMLPGLADVFADMVDNMWWEADE